MSCLELFITIIWILAFVLFIKWRLNSFLPKSNLYFLLISSLGYALVSAWVGYHIDRDSLHALNDAILFKNYIKEDSKNIGALFLTGGNSFYPNCYFPMLDASNTWSNYTNFTFTKYYIVFGYLSSFNLFSISIFFGFISFIAKYLSIQTLFLKKTPNINIKILSWFFIIGGIDIYFVSGLYKECIFFFYLTFLIYVFHSQKSKTKILLSIFAIIQLFLLRFEFAILVTFIILILFLYKNINRKNLKFLIITFAISFFSFLYIYFQTISDYIIFRTSRYKMKQTGKMVVEGFQNTIPSFFKSIIGVFFTPMSLASSNYFIVDIYNILLLVSFIALIYYIKFKFSISDFITISFSSILLLIIGLTVYNYGTILRYRSPFILFIIIFLISQINIKKKYM